MLDFAHAIGCKKGIILSGMAQKKMSKEKMLANLTKAYSQAVELAEKAKITLVLEPLNSLVDHAGYFFDGTSEAVKLIRAINSPNLKLLYDIIICRLCSVNIIDCVSKNIDIIGTFSFSRLPGRPSFLILKSIILPSSKNR
jgi:hydroxypyruvate isomerase